MREASRQMFSCIMKRCTHKPKVQGIVGNMGITDMSIQDDCKIEASCK